MIDNWNNGIFARIVILRGRLVRDSCWGYQTTLKFSRDLDSSQKWKSKLLSHVQLCEPMDHNNPWNSPGHNAGTGCLSLLQGIIPTQGSNPGLPHCSWILHQLSHKGSPRILEWVAYPLSSGSSRPRNQTGVSCISGGFFNNWATLRSPLKMLKCNSCKIMCTCKSQWHALCNYLLNKKWGDLYIIHEMWS